jgi:hypothetical protein
LDTAALPARMRAASWRGCGRCAAILLTPPSPYITAASSSAPVQDQVVARLADSLGWALTKAEAEKGPPARAIAVVRGRRVRDTGMGRLVQQSPAAGAHRQHPAGRSRGTSLCHDGATSHGGVTQNEMASGKPGAVQSAGRFSPLGPVGIGLIFLWDDVKTRSIQGS